jgi:hypothetical protein
MPIMRIKHHTNDFLVVNKSPFRDDNRLSWKAKGILAFLLCCPDNWEINRKEIINHSSDKITSLDSGIKELKEYGYCRVTDIRNSAGKFMGNTYIITELPQQENPNTDNPNMEKPNSENQTLFNIDIIQYIKRHKKEILIMLGAKEKKKSPPSIFHPDTNGGKLAQYFLDQIEKHNPTFVTPNLAIWEKAFNKMVYVSGIPFDEIKKVIFYSQENKFWKKWVDNPYKFESKYEIMKTQMLEKENWIEEKENIFNKAKEEFNN